MVINLYICLILVFYAPSFLIQKEEYFETWKFYCQNNKFEPYGHLMNVTIFP